MCVCSDTLRLLRSAAAHNAILSSPPYSSFRASFFRCRLHFSLSLAHPDPHPAPRCWPIRRSPSPSHTPAHSDRPDAGPAHRNGCWLQNAETGARACVPPLHTCDHCPRSSRFLGPLQVTILFEETFYNDNDESYKVLCIDAPLQGSEYRRLTPDGVGHAPVVRVLWPHYAVVCAPCWADNLRGASSCSDCGRRRAPGFEWPRRLHGAHLLRQGSVARCNCH